MCQISAGINSKRAGWLFSKKRSSDGTLRPVQGSWWECVPFPLMKGGGSGLEAHVAAPHLVVPSVALQGVLGKVPHTSKVQDPSFVPLLVVRFQRPLGPQLCLVSFPPSQSQLWARVQAAVISTQGFRYLQILLCIRS